MKSNHVRDLLAQALAELAEARRHLDYSHQQVAGLPDACLRRGLIPKLMLIAS